jgi:hypothetical protein
MHEIVVNPPAWWRGRPNRERDLLRLAGEVEPEQPGLAMELRGIAMHEASAAGGNAPAPRTPWWQRARDRVWRCLEEAGRLRAERELLELADRWEHMQPNLAKELRAACARAWSD